MTTPEPRARVIFWLCAIATLMWSLPLWWTYHRTGSYDWGYAQNVWEVRWKTLFDYHQWPAHNPWQGGGLPVNPAFGYFSVQALATLGFGAKAGLSIFVVFYLLLGLWGFWQLGLQLFPQQHGAAALLATLGAASPALALHLAAGHLIFLNILVWPAIFYFMLRAATDRWSGLKTGLLFALGFNELPFYVMQYGGLISGVFWSCLFMRGDRVQRCSLRRFALLGSAAALPFMIPSLVGIVVIARDYARVANTPASFTAAELWHAYFSPVTELKNGVYVPAMHGWWGTWEINCYLGVGATLFFLFGFVRPPRWFHCAAAVCFIFTLGNLHWWEPMRWLMATPLFASLQSFDRLRLFTYLFFVIGAAQGFALAWEKTAASRGLRLALALAACASASEVLIVSHAIAQRSHIDFVPPEVKNEHGGAFYQLGRRRGLPGTFEGWPADLALYTHANIGIAAEPAAIDSAFRLTSRVQTADKPDYIGEFIQHGHAVKPAYWSPNRILLAGLDPHEPLVVNLNRGSPWHNFGRPLFPDDRIVEFEKPFIVTPDATGRVELTYRLPYTRLTGSIAAVAALGALFSIIYFRCACRR